MSLLVISDILGLSEIYVNLWTFWKKKESLLASIFQKIETAKTVVS